MPMPKTSMHENDFFPTGKYEVGLSWKVLTVEAKAVTKPMNKGPND
jgi:hypothetical protein